MKVTMTSPFSGITRTKEINVTEAQFNAWRGGELIQNAMPHLSASDREFLMTGIDDEEFDNAFKDA